jgi:hypothetical protein
MVLHWIPDVHGLGGATTLNVDTLGATPVKLPDGVSDPGSEDIAAGRMYTIWYDGSAFRLGTPAASGGSGGGLGYTAENVANKGAANGYAPLDAAGKIPAGNLPAPGASTLGGVQAKDCSAIGLVQKINADGSVSCGSGGGSVDWSAIVNKPTAYVSTVVDTSTVEMHDDFNCQNGPCLSSWAQGGTGSATAAQDGVWPHLGIFRVGGTSSAAGNYGAIALSNNTSMAGNVGFLMAQGPWEFHYIFRCNQTTNTRCYIGWANLADLSSYYETGIRLDTNAGYHDTAFMFISGPGWNGSSGVVSTGVPADTNWHHLKIYWVSANKFAMTLDGGAPKTVCDSGCDLQPTALNQGARPQAVCGSDDTAAAQSMDIDFIGFVAGVGVR